MFGHLETVEQQSIRYTGAAGADQAYLAHQLAGWVPGLIAEVKRLRAELARRPLVDEPGPEVTEVWDGLTDRWQRSGDGWRFCEDDEGSELAWRKLVEMWGPIFLQPTAADQ